MKPNSSLNGSQNILISSLKEEVTELLFSKEQSVVIIHVSNMLDSSKEACKAASVENLMKPAFHKFYISAGEQAKNSHSHLWVWW